MSQPSDDPSAAELLALRQEKAEREAADKATADKEAADLRAELDALRADKKTRDEADAKKVKAPVKKADKPAGAPSADPPPVGKKRARVARRWFGDQADED